MVWTFYALCTFSRHTLKWQFQHQKANPFNFLQLETFKGTWHTSKQTLSRLQSPLRRPAKALALCILGLVNHAPFINNSQRVCCRNRISQALLRHNKTQAHERASKGRHMQRSTLAICYMVSYTALANDLSKTEVLTLYRTPYAPSVRCAYALSYVRGCDVAQAPVKIYRKTER